MRSARKGDQVRQEENKNIVQKNVGSHGMAVAAGAVLMAVGMVAAQSTDPSATREFDTGSVAAGGGPVVATITVSGATQAVVTETLPTGFAYVASSLPDSQVRPDPNDGQRIRFVLADSADNPFTYTVTVSEAGAISGKLTVDRIEYDVTGDDMVTVQEGTDPSATREFDTGSVAAGGGPVVATITVSGATQAVVTETLPTGFAYVSSSLPDSQVRPDPNDGQRIRFVLADSADNPFTYTVTVSEAGSIFGKLTVDRIEYDVTGDDMVTVQEGTDPSATREFDTGSVAAGGGPVVATITVSGATQAVVTETLPTGFAYVASSLPDSQVRPDPNDGQRIRFVLADSADNPFTYTVTVSEAGSHLRQAHGGPDRVRRDRRRQGDRPYGSVDRRRRRGWRWCNACQPCPCIQRGGQRRALRRRELRGWHGRWA